MCGFFGFLGCNASKKDMDRSLALLRHRGPDASATWTNPVASIWLGHTRLAILDLSNAGRQPMEDPTTGNVIVFNGEIYNHREIRQQLVSLGVCFRGTSDTETLLMALGIWGEEIIPRLRGMFAFALYHKASDTVVLGRDRLGIKPLYIGWRKQGGLLFSSEVRPMLHWTGAEISPQGVASYLQRGCCPHGQLLYKNISEFPAGCCARLRSGSAFFEPVRFWPVATEPPQSQNPIPNEPPEKPSLRIRALLENAVQSHMLSDVPVACFLSGGMDSSILASMAARATPTGKLTTFSVGFAESSYDESLYAEEVAKHIGTTHHHIELFEGEKLEMVESAIRAMDLPSIDGINTYLVSREASRGGFKVVLSGLGADEIFGGYPIFRDFSWIRMLSAIPKWARRTGTLLKPGFQLLTDIPQEKTGQALAWWWRRVWTGYDLQKLGMDVPFFESEISPPLRDSMAEISWGEISCYLRDMLIRDSDCMSMAHSLELRVPFLDAPLVEEVLALPSALKFNSRFPKSLLLNATKDLLPERSWNRPKMGFSFPMESWMRRPLRDFCRQGLELAQRHLALDLRQTELIWQKWESKKFIWPKLWALVVLGHYLDSKGDA